MKLRFILICIFSALLLASCGEKEDEPTGGNGHFGGNGGGSGKPSGGNTVTELLIGAWETYFDEGSKYVEFHENGDYFVELTGLEEAAIKGQYYIGSGNKLYIMLDGEKKYTEYHIVKLTGTTLQLGYIDDFSGDMSVETYTKLANEDDDKPENAKIGISAPIIENVTESSIAVKGTIWADDGIMFDSRGVCYGTTPEPTPQDGSVETDVDAVDVMIESLNVGTVYYIRLYAVVDGQTLYGEEVSVKTSGEVVDKIVLKQVEAGCSSVTILSECLDGTGDFGLCYGTSPHPEITDGCVDGFSGVGRWSILDLERGTVYYVRPYKLIGTEVVYIDDSEIEVETIGASVDIKVVAESGRKYISESIFYWKFTDISLSVSYDRLPYGTEYECRLSQTQSGESNYDEVFYVDGGSGNLEFPILPYISRYTSTNLTVTDLETGFCWKLSGSLIYADNDTDIDLLDFEVQF